MLRTILKSKHDDLKRTIETISPKFLFPIHTEKPGKFAKAFKPKTFIVKSGKKYLL